jgi:hypothetical protein
MNPSTFAIYSAIDPADLLTILRERGIDYKNHSLIENLADADRENSAWIDRIKSLATGIRNEQFLPMDGIARDGRYTPGVSNSMLIVLASMLGVPYEGLRFGSITESYKRIVHQYMLRNGQLTLDQLLNVFPLEDQLKGFFINTYADWHIGDMPTKVFPELISYGTIINLFRARNWNVLSNKEKALQQRALELQDDLVKELYMFLYAARDDLEELVKYEIHPMEQYLIAYEPLLKDDSSEAYSQFVALSEALGVYPPFPTISDNIEMNRQTKRHFFSDLIAYAPILSRGDMKLYSYRQLQAFNDTEFAIYIGKLTDRELLSIMELFPLYGTREQMIAEFRRLFRPRSARFLLKYPGSSSRSRNTRTFQNSPLTDNRLLYLGFGWFDDYYTYELLDMIDAYDSTTGKLTHPENRQITFTTEEVDILLQMLEELVGDRTFSNDQEDDKITRFLALFG